VGWPGGSARQGGGEAGAGSAGRSGGGARAAKAGVGAGAAEWRSASDAAVTLFWFPSCPSSGGLVVSTKNTPGVARGATSDCLLMWPRSRAAPPLHHACDGKALRLFPLKPQLQLGRFRVDECIFVRSISVRSVYRLHLADPLLRKSERSFELRSGVCIGAYVVWLHVLSSMGLRDEGVAGNWGVVQCNLTAPLPSPPPGRRSTG